MYNSKAKIIVIEGVDGSGKSTQSELLINYLRSKNKKVFFVHFPYYDSETGQEIAKYLRGESPYARNFNENMRHDPIVELFALNKEEFFYDNKEIFNEYDYVIFDRYSLSNGICHQAIFLNQHLYKYKKDDHTSFFTDNILRSMNYINERSKKLFKSIIDKEHEELQLPKPFITFVLVPTIERVRKTLAKRAEDNSREYLNGKQDINESDENFILSCNELYKIADRNYENCVIIEDKPEIDESSIIFIQNKIRTILESREGIL